MGGGTEPAAVWQASTLRVGLVGWCCPQDHPAAPDGLALPADINECVTDLHTCSRREHCVNTVGSFHCYKALTCEPGYRLEDGECTLGTREHLAGLEGLTQPSEWSLPRSASEVATQTWTVNSEASVERLQPLLSSVRTRPYLCELLEEVAEGADSPDEDEDEEPAVFPCIECSIYFKQKEHLLEHMSQHRRAPGQEPPAELAPLACGECGWAFADPGALERHRQLHQASREKIIEEIQKLKQVPGDAGREARLQCPRCVFGTNSSIPIFKAWLRNDSKPRPPFLPSGSC